MTASVSVLLLVLLSVQIGRCHMSNPELAVGNSTSAIKLLCVKDQDDSRGFQISLSRNISTEQIQISTYRLNNTAIEITIQSFDYIGAFYLICSSRGNQNSSTRSNITIGKAPGLLMRAERCIVYYDRYIECTIIAPTMVAAITNELDYEFRFLERTLFLHSTQPKIYRGSPQLVKIDSSNKTVTFRWFRVIDGNFPPRLRMVVYATLRYFGTSNYTMDMTPVFRISSNFTVSFVSTTDLKIEFNHGNFSSWTLCHGNLTSEEKIQSSNTENTRTFMESNRTMIEVTGLHPDTEHEVCFYCRRHPSFDTISDVECHRYKTLKPLTSHTWYILIIMVCCILCFLAGVLLYRRWNWDWIHQRLRRMQHRKRSTTGSTDIPLAPLSHPSSSPLMHEYSSMFP